MGHSQWTLYWRDPFWNRLCEGILNSFNEAIRWTVWRYCGWLTMNVLYVAFLAIPSEGSSHKIQVYEQLICLFQGADEIRLPSNVKVRCDKESELAIASAFIKSWQKEVNWNHYKRERNSGEYASCGWSWSGCGLIEGISNACAGQIILPLVKGIFKHNH